MYEKLLYAASRFNRSSAVDYLNVWFPAHWAPIVLWELHRREDAYRKAHNLWFDDPHDSDPPRVIEQRKDVLPILQFQVGAMDDNKNLPTLIGKLKIDWLNFPVDDILRQFTTLKDGILRGVFKQQAARAWYGCRAVVVICASRHSPIVDLSPLDMPVLTRAENDGLVERLAADAIVGYQRLAQKYISSSSDPVALSSEEASIWIQTGLALTPFAFAETSYSVDWAIAWAMIGEWTNHQLFPPPKSGEWPRFAHVEGLEEGFHH